MPLVAAALLTFLILVAIGIVVSIVFNRQGRSWIGRMGGKISELGRCQISHAE